MKSLKCYACKGTLSEATRTFENDVWTTRCPTCGVVNKLRPTDSELRDFVVSGAFFIIDKNSGSK